MDRSMLYEDMVKEKQMPEQMPEQMRREYEHYRMLVQNLAEEEARLHEANQKRIKVGIQCLIWIPLLFLALLFLTESEKVIFLVLWIVSLFAIASYLIYIEYIDFKAQERLHTYQDGQDMTGHSLIGGDIEAFEGAVTELLRQIDEKKAENREKMLLALEQHKERVFDKERKGAHHE